MKLLVVGSGGREHTLVWALARSPQVKEIHVAPGNGGMSGRVADLQPVCVPISVEDIPGLTDYAVDQHFDLVVIGPEMPLALGLSDALAQQGLRVFGPSADAARIESSKAFSKDLMREHGIPTADYEVFDDLERARSYVDAHHAPIVVKASGLAAGKGVIVCQTDAEARQALDRIMRERAFGDAGDQVVIEECLTGQEVSVLAFVDGETVAPMVLAQDHKPALDGDKGPNTGGMGCYAPAPLLDAEMHQRVVDQVLQPVVDGLRRAGTSYRGVLYAGLMVLGRDFKVLEFNCRFGDPEAQVILPLMESDLFTVMNACIDGRLDQMDLAWSDKSCVCVVMASRGYPGSYRRGYQIVGLDQVSRLQDTVVFHAGTRVEDGRVLTSGGRVLGVTAWAANLADAVDRAYAAVDRIYWPGAMFRKDIGAKGLARGRD